MAKFNFQSSILLAVTLAIITCGSAGSAYADGLMVTDRLWIRAVIQTVEKGAVDAVWEKGGEDFTAAGDRVIWGYFYTSPDDVAWGSRQNPDMFVKIWFDRNGRVDVNFFHVSVPNIEVYSAYPYNGTPDQHGTTTLTTRYIRQYYLDGQSSMNENDSDENPSPGDFPTGNPSGYATVNGLKIGAIIDTVEKGPVDALWHKGGKGTTEGGHTVLWGYFHASPADVTWGSVNNPDLFVKIWFDAGGRVDVSFFHVSVPDIEVYSDLPTEGDYDQKGTATLDRRYIRHEYEYAPGAVINALQALADQAVDDSQDIRNGVLLVETPDFRWKGAAGMADPDKGTEMLPDDQFRSASVGKTLCATLVMKLVEAGKISLEEEISQYLPESVMNGLHEYDGKSYSNTIITRQLLNHTSGLPDYFFDGPANVYGMSDFMTLMLEIPDKLWEPEETIEYAKTNLTPFFPPGQGYHYSDTNYQLLGLIIESVTDKPLHEVYHEFLFDPLGMNHTYMEFRETPRHSIPGRSLSHVYMGDIDYTHVTAYSAGWAGGGLVTTAEDLNRFIRAFAGNKIFDDLLTREEMFNWVDLGNGAYYGFGLERLVFDEFGIPDLVGLGELWGHSGFGNSFMYYWPEEDISICGTLNQAVIGEGEDLSWLIQTVLPVMVTLKADGAGQTWTEAFDALHEKISAEYAFTEWKGIDWNAKYAEFRPRIVKAESEKDEAAYYLALREYAYSVPDRLMSLFPYTGNGTAIASKVTYQHIGGSYGLAVIGLDDGRILAHVVLDGGPADQAGIRVGAEILKWNGQPTKTALDNVSVIWAGESSYSTNEVRRIEQYRLLGRAPIGEHATITFKNQGVILSTTAKLTALDDNYETYILSNYYATERELDMPVKYKILPSGYGYLKVTYAPGKEDPDFDAFMTRYREAIQTFSDDKVPGVILDLRRNNDADRETAAIMAGFFYTEAAHYETIEMYDRKSGKFKIGDTVEISPQSPHYDGLVKVMVGPGCIGPGEGMAMAVQKLSRGQVISVYGSNGTFGISGAFAFMPGGFVFSFPNGRSLDKHGIVQLDGDADGNGGVIPDIRVPLTAETVYAEFAEGRDTELEFVIETFQNSI